MKRKKSFLTALCTLALALALCVTGVAYDNANAAEPDFVLPGVKVESTVAYGKEIAISSASGYTVTVKAPDGSVTNSVTSNVAANQLGIYTVTYTKGEDSYSYNVYCSLENELELFVENEASVPTVVKTGTVKKLPAAYVGYYDEDGKLVKTDATVTVSSDKSTTAIAVNTDYTFSVKGSNFITYSAQVGSGRKYLTKTFEVKVQDDFVDTKEPTLSVSGVPSSANVNTKVTLPKATASDTFDENVEVVITVQGKNAEGALVNVKAVTVNDDETVITETADDASFDNADNMSFYPVREGDYKVTYKAIDDSGNESAAWAYTITVSDKKAPVLTVDNTKIPAKWGATVKKLAADGVSLEETSSAVKFPMPEFTDNKDAKSAIKIGFTLRDPESKTVVKFDNINAAADADSTKYTSTVVKNAGTDEYKTYAFNNTMTEFSFDFSEYIAVVATDTDYTSKGDYVVTYTAEDAAGNKSTKTFTVNVEDTFEDDEPVTVEFKTVPDSVVASETKTVEFTVPKPAYSSAIDSKLTVAYTVGNGTDTIKVEGGETMEIAKATSAGYKLSYDGQSIAVTDKLVLTATATSDAGNTATAAKEIKLLTPSGALFGDVTASGLATGSYSAGDGTHDLGKVTINLTSADNKDYVGVEVGVKNSEGKYMTDVTASIYTVGSIKYVKLAFNTTLSGAYSVEVRVFDVHGNSTVVVKPFTVSASSASGSIIGSAVTNASSASVNTSIELSNKEIDMSGLAAIDTDIAAKIGAGTCSAVLVREINGGRFALIGTDFTAMSTGKYALSDKANVVETSTGADHYSGGSDPAATEYLNGLTSTSELTVNDNASVNFEVLGIMPTYVAKNGTVTLPDVSAFTENANADEIVIDVKTPNGTKVNTTVSGTTTSFVASTDGEYTVTYTVKMSGKEESTYEFTVKAGDIVAPTFKLTDKDGNEKTHESTVDAGYEFNFLYIVASDEVTTDAEKLTYTKTIIGPDGEVVGTEISGTGTTYANKLYTGSVPTLDESGKYIVRYTVKDAAGNESTKEFEIIVTDSSGNSGISLAALSTILIVVGVLLIAGVIVYLFRFRPAKKDKKDKK